jgi:hypothetical protein
MSSSAPILIGMVAIVFAAFWYDATNSTSPEAPPSVVFSQAAVAR